MPKTAAVRPNEDGGAKTEDVKGGDTARIAFGCLNDGHKCWPWTDYAEKMDASQREKRPEDRYYPW